MFANKARQYPNLVTYLHHVAQRKVETPAGRLSVAAGVGLASSWAAVATVGALTHAAWLAIPATVVALGLAGAMRDKPRALDAPDQLRLDAQETATVMRECLERRRLHRDLDTASLTLLEECARHWHRVNQVFSSPFWQDGLLPVHYHAARDQALRSAEAAMDEVMVLYRPCLPSEVKGRDAMDYVEEALEQYVFRGGTQGNVPPAFVPAREIAEKLRDLANEAERISDDLRHDPSVAAQTAPGGTLDLSLGELRAIREAEEELRQNLRG